MTSEEISTDVKPSESASASDEQGDAVFEAPAVLRMLWADPQYMPEHLALWSLKRLWAEGLLGGREAPQLASGRRSGPSSIGW